jgi:hypothetical protein
VSYTLKYQVPASLAAAALRATSYTGRAGPRELQPHSDAAKKKIMNIMNSERHQLCRFYKALSLNCIFLFFCDSTALWTLAAFSFSESYTHSIGFLGRGISPSQGRYLHKQNKRTQTSMLRVGFEPTAPVF